MTISVFCRERVDLCERVDLDGFLGGILATNLVAKVGRGDEPSHAASYSAVSAGDDARFRVRRRRFELSLLQIKKNAGFQDTEQVYY